MIGSTRSTPVHRTVLSSYLTTDGMSTTNESKPGLAVGQALEALLCPPLPLVPGLHDGPRWVGWFPGRGLVQPREWKGVCSGDSRQLLPTVWYEKDFSIVTGTSALGPCNTEN